jgi:Tol biopolymer transport system component
MTTKAGEIIAERYQLKSLLSQTGDSQVFLATDLRLANNLVAVKVLPAATERFKAIQEQLSGEIASLAQMRHQSVCGLIDTGMHGRRPFLVTQYFPGPTLAQWVKRTNPDQDTRIRVFMRLLNIVESVNDAGLQHLALTPENIIVSSESAAQPDVVVLDFGDSSSDLSSLVEMGRWLLPSLSKSIPDQPQSASDLRRSLDNALKKNEYNNWLLFRLAPAVSLILALFVGLNLVVPKQSNPAPDLREVTSLRGTESEPSLSPDGETIYFGYETRHFSETAIYAAPYAGGEPKLLFSPPPNSRFFYPVASPDGRHLAFLEHCKDGTQFIQYADLKTREHHRIHHGQPITLSFGPSPDRLYFTDQTSELRNARAMLVDLKSNEVEALPAPASPHYADSNVAISPDGKYLLYSRFRTTECADLYLVALNENGRAEGVPTKITSIDRRIQRPQWLPDGRTIIFSAGSLTNFSLWKAVLASNPFAPAATEQLPEWGDLWKTPFAASNSNRLLFASDREDCDIYRVSIENPTSLVRFVSSTRLDEEPRYSPDGRHIAFFSERSGSLQGWIAESENPTSARRITNFELAEKAWPAWTPSGAAIFFARLPKLGPEMLQLDSPRSNAEPHRIFTASHAQRVAGISADATSLFAEITPPDQPHLQRWSLITEGRDVVAPVEARFVREFFRHGNSGERLVFYAERQVGKGLFLLENGKPRRIYPSLSWRNTFAYHEGFAYVLSDEPQRGIYKVNITTGASSLLIAVDRNPGWGMDISPDGKHLIVALYDFDDSNIVATEWPLPNQSPSSRLIAFFQRLLAI